MGTERLADVLALVAEIPLRALPESPEAFVGRTMVLPALHDATGVRVDLVSREGLESSHNWIRRRAILSAAKVLYAA